MGAVPATLTTEMISFHTEVTKSKEETKLLNDTFLKEKFLERNVKNYESLFFLV